MKLSKLHFHRTLLTVLSHGGSIIARSSLIDDY